MAGRSTAKVSSDAASSIELIARVRAGDEHALEVLCARYGPRLVRWAHGRLPAWARGAVDTQDLAQDALIQVVRRIGSFEPRHDAALQAYARQALYNRLRDEVRRARRRPPPELLDSAMPGREPSPLEQAIGKESIERYEAALARLRPADREAIIVRFEMGMSNAEVAQALGKPSEAAAHMTVSRALVQLAREMSRASGAEKSQKAKKPEKKTRQSTVRRAKRRPGR